MKTHSTHMEKEKILLDTDIGSDVDDAVCLAYLLRQPRCELVGITTVSGEPFERAKLASMLCIAAGQPDIPIYPGTARPLLTRPRQQGAAQKAVLSKYPHRTEFPLGQHIDFMRKVIRENPGEITLLAIGPMTNVALLFAVDPEIPKLLKRLVLMCGAFLPSRPHAAVEWNAVCDPYACAMTYNAPVPEHVSVGLDVTLQVTMPAEQVREEFKYDILPIVRDMAEVWFEKIHTMTFHDPLTAVSLFCPEVCKMTRGTVEVEIQGDRARGLTYWKATEEGAHQIATSVDAKAFFKEYFSVFHQGE